ncbi:MAG: carboxypeptidase regulatory-like domain-containing protein [Myxococcota bacterium]
MRRWLLLLVSVAALAGGLAVWLWPEDPPPAPVVEAPAPLPDFTPVDVRATGTQQGLTLTGTVRDPQGAPIAGAEVSLASSGQQSLTGARCGICEQPLLSCRAHETTRTVGSLLDAHQGELVAALTTTSDEQGRFRFEQLSGTSFTVWGRAPGFGEGVKERAAPGDPVELFLPAPRSIAGRLKDEAGRPVQGTVRAVSHRLARPVETTSDAEGRFEVRGLGEGPFYLLATAPGRLPAHRAQVEAGPEPVALTLLAPRRLEVRLVSQGKPIDGVVLLRGDHLTRELAAKGGFLGTDGLYPGELLVSAVSGELSAAPQEVALTGPVTQVTLTLERGGRLAVSVLDDADQPVVDPKLELVTRSGEIVHEKRLNTGELALLGPLAVGDYVLRATADGYEPGRLPVAVKPGETQVVVTMTKGTLITGRVIDEYGRPAPGVSVLITPTGDSVLADAEGRFKAPVPSPGLYALHAHHSDWGGGELEVTAPKTGVELQLEPKAGAEVTVTVDGRRVEGAHVVLLHAEGNYRSDRPSGADGVVLMRGLPPDTYTLVATHPDFLPSDRQTFTLADGQLLKVTAELKAGAAIEGQVVDTLGAPVPNVSVTMMPRGAEPGVTDANGKFSLRPLRPKAVYALRVSERGYDQVDRVLATAGGEPAHIVVKRQPVFRGRVMADGQPLRSFRVDEHEVNSADGRFELPLPATEDRVIVTIEAPGYEPLMTDRPNTPDLGDFTLTRAPLVTGLVRDEGGGPAADAVVTCDSCEQSVLTGPDGRFALGKPPFQREFNVVAKKGRRTAIKTVTDGATQGLELTLRAGVKVTGTAWLSDGQPAAGVEIAGVNVDRSEPVSVVTNADGTFSLEASPGTWRFMMVVPGFQERAADPPALITEVSGTETRIDFGPAPTLGKLVVRVAPQPGFALWLVRGEVPALGDPPMELLRAKYAQLVYQPRIDTVVFGGLLPGRYTLIWARFHAQSAGGPVKVAVDVPGQAEVNLVR